LHRLIPLGLEEVHDDVEDPITLICHFENTLAAGE
jgi:hypothetical protein